MNISNFIFPEKRMPSTLIPIYNFVEYMRWKYSLEEMQLILSYREPDGVVSKQPNTFTIVENAPEEVPEMGQGWERLEVVEKFLACAGMKVYSFMHCENKTTVYFLIGSRNTSTGACLTVGTLLKSLKWWLPVDFTPKGEETLVKALSKREWNEAGDIISAELKNHSVKLLRESILNFVSKSRENAIAEAQRNIDYCYKRIRDYERDLKSQYTQIDSYIGLLEQAKEAPNRITDELLDYINAIGGHISGVDSCGFRFTLYGVMNNYDVEVAKRYFKNEGADMFSCIPAAEKHAVAKALYAVFAEEKYLLRVYCDYYLSYSNELSVDTSEMSVSRDKYIRAPHMFHFQCFGGNMPEILKCLHSSDFVGAFAQISATVSNINIKDSAVTGRFVTDLKATRKEKLFISKDGKEMSLDDIIKEESSNA